MPTQPPGKIITFYSYKGGTGRSMALANVAWILASNGKRVLMIDWDLEAPGLHRYVHPFLRDKELKASDGVIEFVVNFAAAAVTPPADDAELEKLWYLPLANVLRYATSLEWDSFRKPGLLDFIPSGRQGAAYATSVNFFNWQQFYEKLGGHAFLEAAKEKMRASYDYILIDSRTGVSDTSGICTIQMPDMVVLCFTLNTQSIEGAAAVAESIEQQRSDGVKKTIRILPVPTRVEEREHDKLERARSEAWRKFTPYLWHIPKERHSEYWGSIEIFYRSQYAFEEIIAPFGDRPQQKNSLLAEMERLTGHITDGEVTALQPVTELQRQTVAAHFEQHGKTGDEIVDDVLQRVESVYGRLGSADQRSAMRLLKRLIRVPQPNEHATETALTVPLETLSDIPQPIVDAFFAGRILTVTKSQLQEPIVSLCNPVIIEAWTPLRIELDADRDFLRWRQSLRADEWAGTADANELLRGPRLQTAETYIVQRPEDFNRVERRFIERSVRTRRRRQWTFAAAVALPILVVAIILAFRNTTSYLIREVIAEAPRVENDPSARRAVEAWVSALAASDHLGEALAIAGKVRDPSERVEKLALIAAATPDGDRGPVVASAMTSASAIANPVDRAQTLFDFSRVVGSRDRPAAVDALARARRLFPLIVAAKEKVTDDVATHPAIVLANIAQASAGVSPDPDRFQAPLMVAQRAPAALRALLLIGVADRMEQTDAAGKAEAKKTRLIALNSVPAIDAPRQQRKALKEVVQAMTRVGDPAETLAVLRFLDGATLNVEWDSVFFTVLENLQKNGTLKGEQLDLAVTTLVNNRIRVPTVRCAAYAQMAQALAAANRHADAMNATTAAELCALKPRWPYSERAADAAAVAAAQLASGNLVDAKRTLYRASELAQEIEPKGDAYPAYIAIAGVALNAGLPEITHAILPKITPYPSDAPALAFLHALAPRDVGRAIQCASTIPDDEERAQAIRSVVSGYTSTHEASVETQKDVSQVLDRLVDPGPKEAAYESVVVWLAKKFPANAEIVAREHIYDDQILARSFLEIARHFTAPAQRTRLVNEAVDHARNVGSLAVQSPLIADAAGVLAMSGDLARARTVADRCPLPADKLRAYAAILQAHAKR